MTDSAKIRALLSAWLDYLHIENLSNAKVEAKDEQRPRVWDAGVSLLGDNLLLDESLFKELKQQLKDIKQKNKNSELCIAVAFPQLYIIEEGYRQFRPLFTVDVSPIFTGRYRSRGWNLTEFEFQPIIPNLIEWYGLEEETAESLVTQEGLKVFLETTFNHPFKTLQDFIGLIELPASPVRSKLLPYLLNFGYVAFNYNLNKDFAKICSQHHWDWAAPGHPAYEYLFGRPQPPEHEVLFQGAFPTHPATESQAEALKHSQSNPITAVIGPPGNGKTTLLLHKIATQVVKGAVHLATTGESESILTVVTSTNNRAVSNVEELLARQFHKSQFYLSGGSKELVEKQVLPKLSATIDWLLGETFLLNEWEQAKTQLLAGINQLQQHLEQDQQLLEQQAVESQQLLEVQTQIAVLKAEIEKLVKDQQQPQSPDYSDFPIDNYQIIQAQLEKAWLKLSKTYSRKAARKHQHWWQRIGEGLHKVWLLLTRSDERTIIERLNRTLAYDVAATRETSFPMELIINLKHLKGWRYTISQQLREFAEWQQQSSQHQANNATLNSLQAELKQLSSRQQELEQKLVSYPTTDFYSRFYTDLHSLQVQLFELSWQFLQQSALQQKDEVIASLRIYMGVLNNEWEALRQLAVNWRNVYRHLSLLFPVFLSTLHSLRRLFPYPDSGCIDQLIVDEAGQIPVHLLFPALVRCHQALVVGDPMQLEPVIPLSDQKKDEYCAKAFLERELTDIDYDRYSPTVCTAYQRAAGASEQQGDIGNGILLKEHFRCVPSIASLCDRLCDYGMAINTEEKLSKLGTNLIAYHVKGNYSNNVNWAEVDVIETLVKELLAAGYKLNSPNNQNSLGIISPYRRQANALQERLQSAWQDFSNNDIGTVHTFQGGEKSVIILSTRQCQENHSFWFLNRQPNLLNVAVSRARELLIVVGNLERLKAGGSYTKQVVEYIEEFGEIRDQDLTLFN